MNRLISTDTAPPPFSSYAQAVEVSANARTLNVSGQAGVALDGTLPDDATAQHEQAWENVFAVLAAADMTETDIVDVLVIVSDPSGVPIFRQVRDQKLNGHLAATTLLVCGLASPDWKVEIAVKAAKAN
jgi:2-iminobutanoate/2-iminopropanoate deaminase